MSPWAFDLILRDAAKAPLLRACDEYRPHPCATASPLSLEELAKQASRRMEATRGLAAILRDARRSALLRMRSEMYLRPLRMRSQTLMVSSASSRVSNHEATEVRQ